MKKLGLLFIGLALVVLCSSCYMNEKCPAYASNENVTEQNG